MKSSFKISVPNPCHKDWDEMTPVEQGRFCETCATTVIDFTDKSTLEIQNYFRNNYKNEVCGSFRKESLDNVVIHIPEEVFMKKYSFDKLFLLALLVAMGTTLFSCNDTHTSKSINAVEIVGNDAMQQKSIEKDIDSDWKKMVKEEQIKDSVSEKEAENHFPDLIMGKIKPMAPVISENGFKKKLLLVSQKKLSAGDFEKYLDGNIDVPILTNGKRTTFGAFCEKIRGKGINIKRLKILKDESDFIKTIEISYKITSVW